QAASILSDPTRSLDQPLPNIPASAGGPAPYLQVVLADGQVIIRDGGLKLPQIAQAAAVATGQPAYITTVPVHGTTLRMYVFPLTGAYADGQQVAVEIARPLAAVDNVLSMLRLILVIVFVAGIAVAAALGRMAARRVLFPLAEMARTAQLIGETD